MPATGRSAVGRVMVGMGRQPGAAAATTRLRALLDEVNANANPRDAAALGALRDRARTALAETAALTAGVPAVKTEHDALQATLPALERRIAAASGQGPQIGRHRPAPPPAAPAVDAQVDPLRGQQDPANAYGVAPASGYGRVQAVADPPPVDSYVLPDTESAGAQGYGRVVPAAPAEQRLEAYVVPADDASEVPEAPDPSVQVYSSTPADGARAPGYGRVEALRGAEQSDMYTVEDDDTGNYQLDDDDGEPDSDDEDAPAQAVQIPPPPPQPPADGFARRAAQHAERREALHAAETPEDTARRAAAIADYLARELKQNGDLLSAEQRRAFGDEFRRARALVDPGEQAAALDALRREIDTTIGARLREISALMSDLTRLEPLVARALTLLAGDAAEREAHGALAANWETLKTALAAPGGDPRQARTDLDAFEAEVRQALQGISLDTKRAAQSASLRPSPDAPLALGDELGVGNFGRVVELGADANGTGLVGKTRKPGGDDARFRQDIEQEEKIYAQVGEHPNIARCFGIQRIGNEDVLVMEKIEGPKMNEVFSKLEDRYRDGEINREQYLGALQQLIKGTLQGLAQFEAMGMTHRDIKGDNIMFDEATMQPKLVDMGLAQEHGPRQDPMMMVLTTPPEVNAGSKEVDDKWDTFTVGKMLFPQMELAPAKHDPKRSAEPASHYQFVPGRDGAQQATMVQGAYKPDSMTAREVLDAPRQTMIQQPDGSFKAKVGQDGEYVDQALHPTDNARAQPGQFAMDSAYVDFMNRLTHPDPAQRMSASEALRHPFLTQQLGDPDNLGRVLGNQPPGTQDGGQGGSAPPVAYYVGDGNAQNAAPEGLRGEVNYVEGERPAEPPNDPDIYSS